MRKFNSWLFAVMAIGALAMSASSASATTAITVVDEATNTACSSITSPHTTGGCKVHMSGTIELQGWAFVWFHEAACKVETEMRLSGSGVAAIDDLDLFPGDSNCDDGPGAEPVTACDLPWEGSGERVSATVIHATKQACFDVAELDVCGSTVEYDIVESGAANAETYSASFVNSNVGSVCRINGTLSIEKSGTDSPIHVN